MRRSNLAKLGPAGDRLRVVTSNFHFSPGQGIAVTGFDGSGKPWVSSFDKTIALKTFSNDKPFNLRRRQSYASGKTRTASKRELEEQLARFDLVAQPNLAPEFMPYQARHQDIAALLAKARGYSMPPVQGKSGHLAHNYLKLFQSRPEKSRISPTLVNRQGGEPRDAYTPVSSSSRGDSSGDPDGVGGSRYYDSNQSRDYLKAGAVPLVVAFDVPIPKAGAYQLKSRRTSGQRWQLLQSKSSAAKPSNSGAASRTVSSIDQLGELNLEPGMATLQLKLAPNAVVYPIELKGPRFNAPKMFDRWQPNQPLTQQEMVQAFALVDGIAANSKAVLPKAFLPRNNRSDLAKLTQPVLLDTNDLPRFQRLRELANQQDYQVLPKRLQGTSGIQLDRNIKNYRNVSPKLLALASTLNSTGDAVSDGQTVAYLNQYRGSVSIKPSTTKTIGNGSKIASGSQISVGQGSAAEIYIPGYGFMSLTSGTQLSFARVQRSGQRPQTVIRLSQGSLYAATAGTKLTTTQRPESGLDQGTIRPDYDGVQIETDSYQAHAGVAQAYFYPDDVFVGDFGLQPAFRQIDATRLGRAKPPKPIGSLVSKVPTYDKRKKTWLDVKPQRGYGQKFSAGQRALKPYRVAESFLVRQNYIHSFGVNPDKRPYVARHQDLAAYIAKAQGYQYPGLNTSDAFIGKNVPQGVRNSAPYLAGDTYLALVSSSSNPVGFNPLSYTIMGGQQYADDPIKVSKAIDWRNQVPIRARGGDIVVRYPLVVQSEGGYQFDLPKSAVRDGLKISTPSRVWSPSSGNSDFAGSPQAVGEGTPIESGQTYALPVGVTTLDIFIPEGRSLKLPTIKSTPIPREFIGAQAIGQRTAMKVPKSLLDKDSILTQQKFVEILDQTPWLSPGLATKSNFRASPKTEKMDLKRFPKTQRVAAKAGFDVRPQAKAPVFGKQLAAVPKIARFDSPNSRTNKLGRYATSQPANGIDPSSAYAGPYDPNVVAYLNQYRGAVTVKPNPSKNPEIGAKIGIGGQITVGPRSAAEVYVPNYGFISLTSGTKLFFNRETRSNQPPRSIVRLDRGSIYVATVGSKSANFSNNRLSTEVLPSSRVPDTDGIVVETRSYKARGGATQAFFFLDDVVVDNYGLRAPNTEKKAPNLARTFGDVPVLDNVLGNARTRNANRRWIDVSPGQGYGRKFTGQGSKPQLYPVAKPFLARQNFRHSFGSHPDRKPFVARDQDLAAYIAKAQGYYYPGFDQPRSTANSNLNNYPSGRSYLSLLTPSSDPVELDPLSYTTLSGQSYAKDMVGFSRPLNTKVESPMRATGGNVTVRYPLIVRSEGAYQFDLPNATSRNPAQYSIPTVSGPITIGPGESYALPVGVTMLDIAVPNGAPLLLPEITRVAKASRPDALRSALGPNVGSRQGLVPIESFSGRSAIKVPSQFFNKDSVLTQERFAEVLHQTPWLSGGKNYRPTLRKSDANRFPEAQRLAARTGFDVRPNPKQAVLGKQLNAVPSIAKVESPYRATRYAGKAPSAGEFSQTSPTPEFSIDPDAVAYINLYEGPMSVRSTRNSSRLPEVGYPLYKGDQIVTEPSSKLELYIPRSGILNTSGASQLRFNRSTRKNPSIGRDRVSRVVIVDRGTVRVVAENPDNEPIVVRTPSKQVGVTSGRVIIEDNVYALRGKASIRDLPSNRTYNIYPGEGYGPRYRFANRVGKGPGDRRFNANPGELLKLDEGYDFGIHPSQIPFVAKHEDFAAILARKLGHSFAGRWYGFKPQSYIDLFAKRGPDSLMSPTSFVDIVNPQNLVVGKDRNGLPTMTAKGGAVTLTYEMPVPKTGVYQLGGSMVGGPQYWTLHDQPTLVTKASSSMTPSSLNPVDLGKGITTLTISIPEGGRLGSFVVSGAPFPGYEPVSSWSKERILTQKDLVAVVDQLDPKLRPDKSPLNSPGDYLKLLKVAQAFGYPVGDDPNQVVGGKTMKKNVELVNKSGTPADEDPVTERVRPFIRPDARPAPRSPVSPILPTDLWQN